MALCPPSMWSVSFRPLHAGSRRAGHRCPRAGVREAWAGPQTPCRAVVAWSRAVCLADSPGLACVCPAPGVHALTKAFLYHQDSLLYTWTHRRREEGREGAFSPQKAGSWDLGEEDNPTCLKPEAETRVNCQQVQSWVPHSSHIWGRDGPSQPVLCLHLCHWLDVIFSQEWRLSIARSASTSSYRCARW